ncbi:hypothetical protein GCM10009677_32160 [Sphaerisporangium rubeum]|uniref:Serine/threonine protein kinase n=1 Tax=Sphaerisporangium rubeum TaxID=321317 RepID=A0A7X0IDJ7_9ACTN|nr:serine/threonine-protein kinase [Sphaerisporangium rubeum]MBB6472509.1 serine/threonine protein kinase [Sphaerisporangium rubeum]
MSEIAPLRPGDPESLGEYRLTGRIGEGGQGSVYLGTAPTDEHVAVKMLRRGLGDDASAARFQRETEILRRVAPFCTAQVVESGTEDGRPYIVSEYIEGPTLQQSVERDGPLRGARLRRLAVGTMTALTAIHRAGVVHRDFKPSNVLLSRDGPRVIDFGIARALDTSATGSGAIGTPPYMAPEQLEGTSVEPPADLFSWGSTMVFAAIGRPPFGMDSLPAVINRILHKDPDLGDLDGDLRDLIADCLAKAPAVRPTARDALLRLLGAQNRPPGADLLSAGTAAASTGPPPSALTGGPPIPSGTPGNPLWPSPGASVSPVPDTHGVPWPSPGEPVPTSSGPHSVPGPSSGGPVDTGPGLSTSTTRPDGPARNRRGLWIGAAATIAVVSALLAYVLIPRGDDPVSRPTPSATLAVPVPEITAAPPTPSTELTPPGTKTTLYESPGDPVRLTSYMYLGEKESKSYARDSQGGFESVGPFHEPLVSPDGTWLAVLPWLKDTIPQPYDLVRLVERATGREFAVRLTDKPLQNFSPYWSSDGRRLLLTTYDVTPTNNRTAVGFVIVDRETATARSVPLRVPGAAGYPFMWAPGETSVAHRYLDGAKSGVRFYDLAGKLIRTIPNTGDPIDRESMFSPAGNLFATFCPDRAGTLCVWNTTAKRVATVPLPYRRTVIGWYNDAHLLVHDLTKSPTEVTVLDFKGTPTRTLAKIPANETNGNPYRLIPRFTHPTTN